MIPEIRPGYVPLVQAAPTPAQRPVADVAPESPGDRVDVAAGSAKAAKSAKSPPNLTRRIWTGVAMTVGGAVAASLVPVTGAVIVGAGVLLVGASAMKKLEPHLQKAITGFVDDIVENMEATRDSSALARGGLDDDRRQELLMKKHMRDMTRIVGDDNVAVAGNAYGLGDFYRSRNRWMEAIPMYEKGLAILERSLADRTETDAYIDRLVAAALGKEYKDLPMAYRKTAQVFARWTRSDEAEALHQRAVAEREKRGDVLLLAEELNAQATFYRGEGRTAEALPLMERAANLRAEKLGGAHPSLSSDHDELSRVAKELGKEVQAARHGQLANAIFMLEASKRSVGDEHPSLATLLDEIATCHATPQDALRERASMLRLLQKTKGAPYPALAKDLRALATWYKKDGHESVGFRLEQRAKALEAPKR